MLTRELAIHTHYSNLNSSNQTVTGSIVANCAAHTHTVLTNATCMRTSPSYRTSLLHTISIPAEPSGFAAGLAWLQPLNQAPQRKATKLSVLPLLLLLLLFPLFL